MRALLLAALLLVSSGCLAMAAAAPVACKIVNVAEGACMLLTFTGADGKAHTVSCTAKDLTEWGVEVERRHALPSASPVAAPRDARAATAP